MTQDSKSPRAGGVSRRAFLQTAGLAGVAAGCASAPPEPSGGTPPQGLGPGPVPVALKVNGREVRLELEPRVTLLDALRDHFESGTGRSVDLTGSKRVCDRGSCGACTVILDGRTAYACSILAVDAQGREIRTVESFEKAGALHPVQEEFIACDGMMCGFCTPGFVVSSVALLERNPSPTREEIRRALDGNVCRCGTQPRSLEAVEKAAARMKGRR